MKPLIKIITLWCLSLSFACSQTGREIMVDPSLTPSQVVDLFWKGSKNGDEDFVEKLVRKAPDEFYKQCSQKEGMTVSSKEGGISVPRDEEVKKEVLSNKSVPKSKFGRFLEPESKSYNAYLWANLIFVNKYNVEEASIEKEMIYQDQSRVIVQYRNPGLQEDFKLFFFLTKESGGWKIFEVNNSSQLKTVINKNFGISELDCKE